MFPLAGSEFPRSSDQLARAIHDALARVMSLPKSGNTVVIDGGEFPNLNCVKVDLTDAVVTLDSPPPIPSPRGQRTPGITVRNLDVCGQPIRYQQARADFDISGGGIRFDFARDPSGQPVLVLADAESGNVDAKIADTDLQALLLAAATVAAKQQGISVQDLQVKLIEKGPRTIEAEAHIKAKKMVMSGRVLLRGRVQIDDELEATISNLSCTGEGVIGTMASGLLQGKIRQFEGQKIPLTAFSLGDVRLHRLNVSTSRGLHVTAQFGRR